MTSAVRYVSRSGNTKLIAEAIAKGAGVHAVSVTRANAGLKQKADVLFLGGALYAYGIDPDLKEFIQGLDPKLVGKAVLFSSSWVSKHALDIMKKELQAKGITVADETLYVRSKPNAKQTEEAIAFGKKFA